MLEYIMRFHLLLYGMITMAAIGVMGMFFTHLTYRRIIKNAGHISDLREKWLTLWKTRERLLRQMNYLVWYPSLFSIIFFLTAFFYTEQMNIEDGLPLVYLYTGTAIPVFLLLWRHALDFTYREALFMGNMTDQIERLRKRIENLEIKEPSDKIEQELLVEQIAESIRQTAAAGSHFHQMLTEEETEIMKEIIREFMKD